MAVNRLLVTIYKDCPWLELASVSTALRRLIPAHSWREPHEPGEMIDQYVDRLAHDKYKRTLADVLLPDGTNLIQELVKQGWGCWYRKYAPGDTTLERLETEARRGL